MKVETPVSIIIPVFNEAQNIRWMLAELNQFLENTFSVFEIIVVNDGSTDNTLKKLESLGNEFKAIRYVNLTWNSGQSFALLSGIKIAVYNVNIIMDGDGQYVPDDIEKLYGKLNNSIRLVSGKRDNRKDSFLYRTSSFIGNQIIAWLFRTKKFDLGCGLKIGYRDDFLRLPYFKNIHRYLQIIYIHSGLEVADVEISHRQRKMGKSKYSIFKVFNIFPRLLWLKITGLNLKNNQEK